MQVDPAIAVYLRNRAEDAVRAGDAHAASILFAEALEVGAQTTELEMSCGRAFADAGDYPSAIRHLEIARDLAPGSAAISVEIGRCHRRFGRLQAAEEAFDEAIRHRPVDPDAIGEIASLRASGWVGRKAPELVGEARPDRGAIAALAQNYIDRARPEIIEELLPEPEPALPIETREHIHIQMAGRIERTEWGFARTLRGIEAVRGLAFSMAGMAEVRVRLNGETIARQAPRGPFPTGPGGCGKYAFNVWIDFSPFAPGRYELEVMLGDLRGAILAWREAVVVAPAPPFEASDGWIPPIGADPPDVAIPRLPTMVRPALRQAGPAVVRSILVQRLDQLGDLILSIPAIGRLREMFPEARLTGLVTPANADFARAERLFDELVEVEFPDHPRNGRTMTREMQEKLAAALARHQFDIAIDLCEGKASRPLLLLSGAPLMFGFGAREFPWLNAEVQGFTHDPRNGHEIVSHGVKLRALVEWLGTILSPGAPTTRRREYSVEPSTRFGLAAGERFALLHTGARLPFSRWRHFRELARMIAERRGIRVLLIGDTPDGDDPLPSRVSESYGTLPFDELDTLVQRCAIFVGNDSGPKHLAALRGAKIVSLHMARNNWSEWGQEAHGLVLSRRVPCAGCLIQRDPEDCGRDLACLTGITAEDVFDAVDRYL